MRKTKLIALLLAVAMIASMVVPGVAAEDAYTVSIVDYATGAAAIDAEAGDQIILKLVVSGNPGISSLGVEVAYPEDWSILGTQDKKLFSDKASANLTASETYEVNPYFLNWWIPFGTDSTLTEAGGKLSFENGDLLLIQFQIPETAATGTYDITLDTTNKASFNFYSNVDEDGVILPDTDPNSGRTFLDVATVGMTINVTGTEPAGEACPEHTDVTEWTEIAEGTWTGGAIAEGHYKLTGNQTPTTALTVAGNVCIDLNGYNITGPSTDNVRVFEIAATGALVISDSAETDGVISGGQVKNTTTTVTVTDVFGGNIYNEGTFTLYGGTISGGYAYTTANYYPHISGGNIYGAAGSTINIKGGTVTGGKVYKAGSYTTTNGIGGGNIFSEGTVNISGGTISNGTVEKQGSISHVKNRKNYIYGGNIRMRGGELNISGDAVITDGQVIGVAKNSTGAMTAYIRGGNIYAEGTTVAISGGTISNGLIDVEVNGIKGDTTLTTGYVQGGNIAISGGTAAISGGTITGGTVCSEIIKNSTGSIEQFISGGNLAVVDGAVVNMTAGNISAGRVEKPENYGSIAYYGGNVVAFGDGSQFTMSGGTLSDGYAAYRGGNLAIHESGTATLSGTAVLKNGVADTATSGYHGAEIVVIHAGSNLYINDNAQVQNTSTNTVVYAITNGNITINGGKVEGEIWAAGTDSNPNATLTINGGEVDTFGKSAVVAAENLVVGNGVISKKNPIAYMVGEAVVLSAKTEKYTTYETLTGALEAAASGDTVLLAKEASATKVEVRPGVTLDLNGNNLTADEATSAFDGAHIVDSVGTGKLAAESVSYAGANNQLPIAVEGGYVFETVEFAQKLTVDTTAVYKFYITNEAAATALDEAILNGDAVAINVKVTWTNANGEPKEKTFTLGEELLAQYAGAWDTKMITLTINDLTGVSNLTCTAQVVANGVTVEA